MSLHAAREFLLCYKDDRNTEGMDALVVIILTRKCYDTASEFANKVGQ